ncbi:MAG: hypothetical protein RLO15_08435 [Parvibaculum sp.]
MVRIQGTGAVFLLAAAALAAGDAQAGAVKVYSPYVSKGEAEIEYQGYVTFDSDSTKDNEQKHKVGLAYGITDFWATEIYGSWARSPGGSMDFDATEWENRFQLTKRGEYFVDLGFLVEYEHVDNRQTDADEIAFGPLIAKDIGQTTTTANFIFERQIGANRSSGVGFTYRLQELWRLDEAFEPGIEMFGELGPVNDFESSNRQEHMVGPIVQGEIEFDGIPGELKYNVGYLFGVTGATADGTLKSVIEYEFDF